MAVPSSPSTRQVSDYGDAYPNSRKVFVEAGRIRVPMREVSLSGGESPVLLYDTSGARNVDPRVVFPPFDVTGLRGAAMSMRCAPPLTRGRLCPRAYVGQC